jgi:hypothetical protein
MRRFGLLLLVVMLVGCDVTVLRRALLAGSGGGTFTGPSVLYGLFNGQNGDGVYAIGAATRAGGTWIEPVSSPVLTKTGAGWESAHVKDPWLFWDGSQYVIFYSGYDGSKYQIGRATAASWSDILAGTITRYAGNPIISVGAGGSFDASGVAFGTFHYDATAPNGHVWWCWYSGVNAGGTYTMGVAYSDDGTSWTKGGEVLAVGSGWDAVSVGPGAIFYEAPTWTMLYGGRSATPRTQGGIVTFTDPLGTITRYAGNPLLRARFNDAGTSQLLTANTGAGSTSVSVGDSAVYNVGEPVILESTATLAEIHSIAALPNATTVTLGEATVGAFNTSATAGFRPFTWHSVGSRSGRAISGGYEAYFGPFQPLDDISPSPFGNHLWEGTMRATAASLTDTWTFDYTTGLVFPLYPATTGWHKFSAENLSVIAAP